MARARIGLRDPDYLSRPSVPIFKRCIRAHWFPHRPSSDVRAVADIGNRTTFGMVSMNISCGPILLPRPRTRRRIRLLSGAPLFPTISNMLGDAFLGQWNSLVGYIFYYAGPVKDAQKNQYYIDMRHVTDPDHVIAVTTIVERYGKVNRTAPIGGFGGVGQHSRFSWWQAELFCSAR
jgi:hypothetical protein